MEKEPLVSIIVNCYNSEKYLRETVESIFAQSYTNYEIIFWDNQSTDTTAAIIKSFDDPRVNYYYAEQHTTLGEARNLAMQKVKGKFLTFLDSDDVWLPEFLKRAVLALSSTTDYAFFYSNYYNWIDGKEIILYNAESKSSPKDFDALLRKYMIGMSAAVVKHEVIKEKSIDFDSRFQLIEDYDFFLKIAHVQKGFYDSNPLMKYRMHSGSLTMKNKEAWALEFRQLHDKLISEMLSADEIQNFKLHLKWLKVRALNAEGEKMIELGNKWGVLKLCMKNFLLDKKILFLLLGLILSPKQYFLLKKNIRTTSYRI